MGPTIHQQEPEEPLSDDKMFECTLRTSFSEDGIPIDGHQYISGLAFHDIDTERWYFVDRCSNCGKYSVGWVMNGDENNLGALSAYRQRTKIGG